MLVPPRPSISSAAFTAKPIFAVRSTSAAAILPKETRPSQSMTPVLPGLALGKRPRSPSQSDREQYSNPRSSYDEWVLESEFLGHARDNREDDGDGNVKSKGKEKETDDKTTQNKRQQTGRPMQRTEMTSYILYCPNGRKVLLPCDGTVAVAQLCLEEDIKTPDTMPTPPADPPVPKPLSLLSTGPPKPIGTTKPQSVPLGELVRLSARFNFLLIPPNTSTELAKVIRLGCPENAAATETGHVVAHISRLVYGQWYCRRAPLASVKLLWPANTALSLPVSQPLKVLALPRQLVVHVGPETGPGAPASPELHEEFLGGGLTYFSCSKMGTLEVVLNPWTQTVFTMPGPDVEADEARLEAASQVRFKKRDEKEKKEEKEEKKRKERDENETDCEEDEDKGTGNKNDSEKDARKNGNSEKKPQSKQRENKCLPSVQTVVSIRKPLQSEARSQPGTKAPTATNTPTSEKAKASASTFPSTPASRLKSTSVLTSGSISSPVSKRMSSAPSEPSSISTATPSDRASSPEKTRGSSCRRVKTGQEMLYVLDDLDEVPMRDGVSPEGLELILEAMLMGSEKCVAEKALQSTPVPAPVHPAESAGGPPNPLDQKDQTIQKPPQKHRPGMDLPQLFSEIPLQHVSEQLPSLRGLIQETDALHAKRPAVPKSSTPPPPPPMSSSHLPQRLHQFLRQAPLPGTTRLPLAETPRQDRSHYGEQLRERHRTYQDRRHRINLRQHQ